MKIVKHKGENKKNKKEKTFPFVFGKQRYNTNSNTKLLKDIGVFTMNSTKQLLTMVTVQHDTDDNNVPRKMPLDEVFVEALSFSEGLSEELNEVENTILGLLQRYPGTINAGAFSEEFKKRIIKGWSYTILKEELVEVEK